MNSTRSTFAICAIRGEYISTKLIQRLRHMDVMKSLVSDLLDIVKCVLSHRFSRNNNLFGTSSLSF